MKVLAAMSGGVDSSTMAALLCKEGHEIVGATMKLFDDTLTSVVAEHDAVLHDIDDAKAVCDHLDIPHHTFDFSGIFRESVIDRFCCDYLEGRTPNPCINCNRYLKIAALQQHRKKLGLDAVATGHYARVRFDAPSERWQLCQAADINKDQSYVLYHLSQDDLAHLLLPLGEHTKDEVRALAASHGFANADKPESQDICFVPDGDYPSFIRHYAAAKASATFDMGTLEPGTIIDTEGNPLGTHRGIAHYTIGQRKGLGIAASEPLYVCAKDATRNTLTVGKAAAAQGTHVEAHDINMVSVAALDGPTRVQAKTHYRQQPQPALATQPDSDTLVVDFDAPQRLAAPGQSLVIYRGDIVLGGGTIA